LPQIKDSQARVKKVSAFPFEIEYKTAAATLKAQVVKLSSQGFMMELEGNNLRLGERIEFSFILPVLGHLIASGGVVIKIYSQFAGALTASEHGGHINLIEIHFKNLTIDQKNFIYDFLKKLQTSKAS
jgi:hypothetical protein